MRAVTATLVLLGWCALCAGDDAPAPVAPGAAAPRAQRPRQAAPVAAAAATSAAADPATPAAQPKFTTEAKWLLAGYNNNEVVYTIMVTNQDVMIIRCTAEMHGFYIEDGQKQTISDRQVSTIFPNQSAPIGNWMDLDESSGATYSVKCQPI